MRTLEEKVKKFLELCPELPREIAEYWLSRDIKVNSIHSSVWDKVTNETISAAAFFIGSVEDGTAFTPLFNALQESEGLDKDQE